MLSYIVLVEQDNGSLLCTGVRAGPLVRHDGSPAHIPKPPRGTHHVEINYARYAEFQDAPLIPGKTYRATLRLDGAKAVGFRAQTRPVTKRADFDLVDIPPPRER